MKQSLAMFVKYRHLLFNLIGRDLKVKYRRSVLGILWSVLNPLLMMLVITAVFSNIFKFNIEHFPVYYLTGYTLFNFFSEATNICNSSILEASALIKKVYIPKYIFPLEKVTFALVNMLFSLIAMALIYAVTQTPIHWTALLFPIPIIYTFCFALGMGLLLSALTVYFRDILHLYGVVLTAWMYLTPIFYPVDPQAIPAFMLTVFKFNPLYHFVTYNRNIMMNGVVPGLTDNLICMLFAGGALIVGVLVFRKLQRNFILHI